MTRDVVLLAQVPVPGDWEAASAGELPDLDTAIAAGRLLPAASTVEIRPVTTVEGHESV